MWTPAWLPREPAPTAGLVYPSLHTARGQQKRTLSMPAKLVCPNFGGDQHRAWHSKAQRSLACRQRVTRSPRSSRQRAASDGGCKPEAGACRSAACGAAQLAMSPQRTKPLPMHRTSQLETPLQLTWQAPVHSTEQLDRRLHSTWLFCTDLRLAWLHVMTTYVAALAAAKVTRGGAGATSDRNRRRTRRHSSAGCWQSSWQASRQNTSQVSGAGAIDLAAGSTASYVAVAPARDLRSERRGSDRAVTRAQVERAQRDSGQRAQQSAFHQRSVAARATWQQLRPILARVPSCAPQWRLPRRFRVKPRTGRSEAGLGRRPRRSRERRRFA